MSNAAILAAFLALVTVTGCGEGKPFDTVAVDGVVTLNGEPVEGATVVFQPATGSGMAASGLTNSSGVFNLTTSVAGDGAMPGNYKISVSKVDSGPVEDVSGLSFEEALKKSQEAELAKMKKANAKGELPPPADLLPAKYKSFDSSGLTYEVKSGQENHVKLELSK
jgi:hypothetical protein